MIAATSSVSMAQQVHVDANAQGPFYDGTSWLRAWKTVQNGLTDPNLATTQVMWVAKGTYKPGTIPSSTFVLPCDTSFYGGFLGTETALGQRPSPALGTILSGDIDGIPGSTSNDCEHVVTILPDSHDIHLDGFAVRHGHADQSGVKTFGGGILMDGESSATAIWNITFDEVRLRDNYAWRDGGGIYANYAGFGMKFSVLHGNTSDLKRGGGIFLRKGVNVDIVSTQFRGNRAHEGGGGLAVFENDTGPHVYNCEFRGNFSNKGAGVYINSNDGGYYGNCTVVSNEAFEWVSAGFPGVGAGFYVDLNGHVSMRIFNSITWYNTKVVSGRTAFGSSIEGPDSGPATLTVTYSDIERLAGTVPPPSTPWPGAGNIFADPLFVSPSTSDYNLGAASPCLDAGFDPWPTPYLGVSPDFLDLDANGFTTTEATPYDIVAGNAREVSQGGGNGGVDDPNWGVPGAIVDMGCRERQ